MKKFIRFWLPVILYMAAIFIASSRQKVALTDSYTISFIIFKGIHIIEYALFYIISYRAFRNTVSKKIYAHIYAFIFIVLYAAIDEIHQSFVPTREGKFRDVIIDAIGGGLGWILLIQFLPKAPKRLKNLAKKWQIL
jgi:VanZ family protein